MSLAARRAAPAPPFREISAGFAGGAALLAVYSFDCFSLVGRDFSVMVVIRS
jgi:hypothetical protein